MSQINELNRNIEGKNRKIKSTYKSMRKVRVYFQVQVYTLDKDLAFQSDDFDSAKAKRAWKALTNTPSERAKLLSMRPAKYVYQLVRIQTGGYVGGIILGGSRSVVEEFTF